MIVFLPPSFSVPAGDNCSDAASGTDPVVFINRVHKQAGLVVYDIEIDPFQSQSQSQSQPKLQETIEDLYDRLCLTPLGRIPNMPPGTLCNVFAVVCSATEATEAVQQRRGQKTTVPFGTVELFDCCCCEGGGSVQPQPPQTRVQLRLWRQLSSWARVLQPGDCIQVRDAKVGTRLSPMLLHSTADTQLFLLASQDPTTRLSARVHRLSAPEQRILCVLQRGALACRIDDKRVHVDAFRPIVLAREPGGFWQLYGQDGRVVEFRCGLDAGTWIQLQDLIDSGFAKELSFTGLSRDLAFLPESTMQQTAATAGRPTPLPADAGTLLPAAFSASAVFNGLITLQGTVQLHRLFPSDADADADASANTLNASLSTSQPERLKLIVSGTEASLVLDNLQWRPECFAEREHVLLVRTVVNDVDDEQIVRKSFVLL